MIQPGRTVYDEHLFVSPGPLGPLTDRPLKVES